MRGIARWCVLALALSVSACIEGTTGPPGDVSEVGTWDLQTVDGGPLPFVVSPGGPLGGRLSWMSCALTLAADRQVTSRSSYFDGGSITLVNHGGTYVRSGSAVTITFDSGETDPGTFSGQILTLTMPGPHTLGFLRRLAAGPPPAQNIVHARAAGEKR